MKHSLGDIIMRHGVGPYGRDALIEIIEDVEGDFRDRLQAAVANDNKCIDCFLADGTSCSACYEIWLEAQQDMSNLEKEVDRLATGHDNGIDDDDVCAICKSAEPKAISGLEPDGTTHRLCGAVKKAVDETQLHWAAHHIDESRKHKRRFKLALGAGVLGTLISGVLGAVLGAKAARKW